MIAVLAHRHLRQQPRSRQAFLNRGHRFLRRHHRAALRAGVFLARFLDHHQRGGHVFQPLTDLFPDPLQLCPGTPDTAVGLPRDHRPLAAAARISAAAPAMPLASCRVPLAAFSVPAEACGLARGLSTGTDQGDRKQKELVLIHPFAPRPVARPQQLLHPVLQLPQPSAPWSPPPPADSSPSGARPPDHSATSWDQWPPACFSFSRSARSSSTPRLTHSFISSRSRL